MRRPTLAVSAVFLLAALSAAQAQTPKPRARELGISPLIGGTPGALDAITDVAAVEVGHTTLISGEGKLVQGQGPVRTGVTIVHPRGKSSPDPVFGAWFTLNGNGEMTGTTWLQEGGILEGPIGITNTHSVGVVRDAILEWQVKRPGLQPWGLPMVAETYDGFLNDINGFHVKPTHAIAALDGASGGRVAEGNVGGGTGMVCLQFKGGIGTASRVLDAERGGYTVGVLVQCNFGLRPICAWPECPWDWRSPTSCPASLQATPQFGLRPHAAAPRRPVGPGLPEEAGSIIAVVATDAPPASSPVEADRHPCGPRRGPERRHGRQRLGRHLRRVLDRQCEGRLGRNGDEGGHAAQPEDGRPLHRHRPGHRRSDHQRPARGRDPDRDRRGGDEATPP